MAPQITDPDLDIADNKEFLTPVFQRCSSNETDDEQLRPGLLVSAWMLERGFSLTVCNRNGRTVLDLLEVLVV